MGLTIDAIDHIVLNVSDVETSAAWYQRLLGFGREDFDPGHGKARRTSITFGQQKINLRPAGADLVEWFTGACPTPGSDDLCFLTQAEPPAVVAHLQACGVAIEEGPIRKQGARGALRSVYCRDPDGNLVEISSYES
ncbi:VOC family protein [Beijerinckia sp. L45]|uniref:VOC family protein n=1 Tax=Beijerinckia sp. L45 TaxID=1641855 RepID=UPI00131C30C3|nr:VOC family protein [Beijerinckia sp. L45]